MSAKLTVFVLRIYEPLLSVVELICTSQDKVLLFSEL